MKNRIYFRFGILIALLIGINACTFFDKKQNTKPASSQEQICNSLQQENFQGNYTIEDNDYGCELNLTLFYENNKLKYKLITGTRELSDDVEIELNEEKNGYYITLTNIEWSECKMIEYDAENDEQIDSDLPLPVGIQGSLYQNEIIIQNTGNSMNYYVQLGECDLKYIRLIKTDTQDEITYDTGYSQSEELENNKTAYINNIITLFKQKDIDKIASIINFPLRREYPIPNIENEKEFKQRFNEVFDKALIDTIANSEINQWSEVGWRGIMFENGIVWIDSDEGKIIAVNYQSEFERKRKHNLITKEKENLHLSLKNFESPTYRIKTQKYLIRIDKLSNNKYRYASWKISEKESSKPDIILNTGEIEFLGSGGNHIITFTNQNYTYKIYRDVLKGVDDPDPDILLEIEKDGETILTENGTLITE